MMIGIGITPSLSRNGALARAVLNTLSAPAAFAASPRRLNDSYAGVAMRVRRSSDNVEADIGFLSNGDLDTAALLAHCGAGSGFVTTLYDQSGLVRNLVQATPANQPRIVNAGVIDRMTGGTTRPMIRTDGLTHNLATGVFAIPQPYSRSSVLQFVDVVPVNKVLMFGVSSPGPTLLIQANTLYVNAGNLLQIKTAIAVGDTATVAEILSGAASSASYNGAAVAGDAGANALTGVSVGSGAAGVNPTSAFFGDVIIFPSALSNQDRVTLEANQKAYYGTP